MSLALCARVHSDGKVTDFIAKFKVLNNGQKWHTHIITNFSPQFFSLTIVSCNQSVLSGLNCPESISD